MADTFNPQQLDAIKQQAQQDIADAASPTKQASVAPPPGAEPGSQPTPPQAEGPRPTPPPSEALAAQQFGEAPPWKPMAPPAPSPGGAADAQRFKEMRTKPASVITEPGQPQPTGLDLQHMHDQQTALWELGQKAAQGQHLVDAMRAWQDISPNEEIERAYVQRDPRSGKSFIVIQPKGWSQDAAELMSLAANSKMAWSEQIAPFASQMNAMTFGALGAALPATQNALEVAAQAAKDDKVWSTRGFTIPGVDVDVSVSGLAGLAAMMSTPEVGAGRFSQALHWLNPAGKVYGAVGNVLADKFTRAVYKAGWLKGAADWLLDHGLSTKFASSVAARPLITDLEQTVQRAGGRFVGSEIQIPKAILEGPAGDQAASRIAQRINQLRDLAQQTGEKLPALGLRGVAGEPVPATLRHLVGTTTSMGSMATVNAGVGVVNRLLEGRFDLKETGQEFAHGLGQGALWHGLTTAVKASGRAAGRATDYFGAPTETPRVFGQPREGVPAEAAQPGEQPTGEALAAQQQGATAKLMMAQDQQLQAGRQLTDRFAPTPAEQKLFSGSLEDQVEAVHELTLGDDTYLGNLRNRGRLASGEVDDVPVYAKNGRFVAAIDSTPGADMMDITGPGGLAKLNLQDNGQWEFHASGSSPVQARIIEGADGSAWLGADPVETMTTGRAARESLLRRLRPDADPNDSYEKLLFDHNEYPPATQQRYEDYNQRLSQLSNKLDEFYRSIPAQVEAVVDRGGLNPSEAIFETAHIYHEWAAQRAAHENLRVQLERHRVKLARAGATVEPATTTPDVPSDTLIPTGRPPNSPLSDEQWSLLYEPGVDARIFHEIANRTRREMAANVRRDALNEQIEEAHAEAAGEIRPTSKPFLSPERTQAYYDHADQLLERADQASDPHIAEALRRQAELQRQMGEAHAAIETPTWDERRQAAESLRQSYFEHLVSLGADIGRPESQRVAPEGRPSLSDPERKAFMARGKPPRTTGAERAAFEATMQEIIQAKPGPERDAVLAKLTPEELVRAKGRLRTLAKAEAAAEAKQREAAAAEAAKQPEQAAPPKKTRGVKADIPETDPGAPKQPKAAPAPTPDPVTEAMSGAQGDTARLDALNAVGRRSLRAEHWKLLTPEEQDAHYKIRLASLLMDHIVPGRDLNFEQVAKHLDHSRVKVASDGSVISGPKYLKDTKFTPERAADYDAAWRAADEHLRAVQPGFDLLRQAENKFPKVPFDTAKPLPLPALTRIVSLIDECPEFLQTLGPNALAKLFKQNNILAAQRSLVKSLDVIRGKAGESTEELSPATKDALSRLERMVEEAASKVRPELGHPSVEDDGALARAGLQGLFHQGWLKMSRSITSAAYFLGGVPRDLANGRFLDATGRLLGNPLLMLRPDAALGFRRAAASPGGFADLMRDPSKVSTYKIAVGDSNNGLLGLDLANRRYQIKLRPVLAAIRSVPGLQNDIVKALDGRVTQADQAAKTYEISPAYARALGIKDTKITLAQAAAPIRDVLNELMLKAADGRQRYFTSMQAIRYQDVEQQRSRVLAMIAGKLAASEPDIKVAQQLADNLAKTSNFPPINVNGTNLTPIIEGLKETDPKALFQWLGNRGNWSDLATTLRLSPSEQEHIKALGHLARQQHHAQSEIHTWGMVQKAMRGELDWDAVRAAGLPVRESYFPHMQNPLMRLQELFHPDAEKVLLDPGTYFSHDLTKPNFNPNLLRRVGENLPDPRLAEVLSVYIPAMLKTAYVDPIRGQLAPLRAAMPPREQAYIDYWLRRCVGGIDPTEMVGREIALDEWKRRMRNEGHASAIMSGLTDTMNQYALGRAATGGARKAISILNTLTFAAAVNPANVGMYHTAENVMIPLMIAMSGDRISRVPGSVAMAVPRWAAGIARGHLGAAQDFASRLGEGANSVGRRLGLDTHFSGLGDIDGWHLARLHRDMTTDVDAEFSRWRRDFYGDSGMADKLGTASRAAFNTMYMFPRFVNNLNRQIGWHSFYTDAADTMARTLRVEFTGDGYKLVDSSSGKNRTLETYKTSAEAEKARSAQITEEANWWAWYRTNELFSDYSPLGQSPYTLGAPGKLFLQFKRWLMNKMDLAGSLAETGLYAGNYSDYAYKQGYTGAGANQWRDWAERHLHGVTQTPTAQEAGTAALNQYLAGRGAFSMPDLPPVERPTEPPSNWSPEERAALYQAARDLAHTRNSRPGRTAANASRMGLVAAGLVWGGGLYWLAQMFPGFTHLMLDPGKLFTPTANMQLISNLASELSHAKEYAIGAQTDPGKRNAYKRAEQDLFHILVPGGNWLGRNQQREDELQQSLLMRQIQSGLEPGVANLVASVEKARRHPPLFGGLKGEWLNPDFFHGVGVMGGVPADVIKGVRTPTREGLPGWTQFFLPQGFASNTKSFLSSRQPAPPIQWDPGYRPPTLPTNDARIVQKMIEQRAAGGPPRTFAEMRAARRRRQAAAQEQR